MKNRTRINIFLLVFSIIASALCWLVVVMTQGTTSTVIVRDVPVRIDAQSAALAEIGLHPIETETQYVDIEVDGLSTVVGILTPEDFNIVARLNGVTEAATYDLSLTSANQSPSPDYTIRRYTPSTVKVRFDRIERRAFRVEERINGLAIAGGYTEKNTRVLPETVNIEGPAADLDKISRVGFAVDLSAPLERTYAGDFPIVLYDANGLALDPTENNLTVDATEAQLIIQVLKLAQIPLTFDYLTPPLGFPMREFESRVSLSLEEGAVTIAGPEETIDGMEEINLGYIDVRAVTPENNTFPFNVRLPEPVSQFERIDNISSVVVSVDMSGLTSARFNVSDFRVIGAPLNYNVEVLAQALPDVQFVGRPEILEALTAENIVAEVDLSERDVVSGSYVCPVKISVPGRGLVWAVGDHTVTVQVTVAALDEDEAAEADAYL
jgi:YbbR domain-containing protein